MRTRVLGFLCCVLIATGAFANATITIKNNDGPTNGFNDPTAAQAVGGNEGTTIGQQRLNVFQRAAAIWGDIIDSPVEIVVDATWADLSCTETTATLGSAGARYVANFENAPLQDVWYPLALANKFAGRDLRTEQSEIVARFNQKLGQTGCLDGRGWYLGFDGNEGEQSDLLVVILHEMAHGLGFAGLANPSTGAQAAPSGGGTPLPSIFERHMLDAASGLRWDQMTDEQRVLSAVSDQKLLWDGEHARNQALRLLGAMEIFRVNSPSAIAAKYSFGTASFGARLPSTVVTADIVQAEDAEDAAGASRTDGCSTFTNADSVRGRYALIDRGTCTFVQKSRNAQTTGAIGVVIVNNDGSDCVPPGLGGTDTSVTIPVISLKKADGDAIRAELGRGVSVTMGTDPLSPAGADAASRFLKLYAPCEVEGGSSLYHWDTTSTPNLLMEPRINGDLSPLGVDITVDQLIDIGWTTSVPRPIIPSGRRSLKRGNQ